MIFSGFIPKKPPVPASSGSLTPPTATAPVATLTGPSGSMTYTPQISMTSANFSAEDLLDNGEPGTNISSQSLRVDSAPISNGENRDEPRSGIVRRSHHHHNSKSKSRGERVAETSFFGTSCANPRCSKRIPVPPTPPLCIDDPVTSSPPTPPTIQVYVCHCCHGGFCPTCASRQTRILHRMREVTAPLKRDVTGESCGRRHAAGAITWDLFLCFVCGANRCNSPTTAYPPDEEDGLPEEPPRDDPPAINQPLNVEPLPNNSKPSPLVEMERKVEWALGAYERLCEQRIGEVASILTRAGDSYQFDWQMAQSQVDAASNQLADARERLASKETELSNLVKQNEKLQLDVAAAKESLRGNHCMVCNAGFHTVRRKHHCRICNRCICWECGPYRMVRRQPGREPVVFTNSPLPALPVTHLAVGPTQPSTTSNTTDECLGVTQSDNKNKENDGPIMGETSGPQVESKDDEENQPQPAEAGCGEGQDEFGPDVVFVHFEDAQGAPIPVSSALSVSSSSCGFSPFGLVTGMVNVVFVGASSLLGGGGGGGLTGNATTSEPQAVPITPPLLPTTTISNAESSASESIRVCSICAIKYAAPPPLATPQG